MILTLTKRQSLAPILQGFLFSAYSLSISAEATAIQHESLAELEERLHAIRQYLAISGVISSIFIAIGILAASLSMYALVKSWQDRIEPLTPQERDSYPQIIGQEVFDIRGGLVPVRAW